MTNLPTKIPARWPDDLIESNRLVIRVVEGYNKLVDYLSEKEKGITFRIKDDGKGRAITFNSLYSCVENTLPTATTNNDHTLCEQIKTRSPEAPQENHDTNLCGISCKECNKPGEPIPIPQEKDESKIYQCKNDKTMHKTSPCEFCIEIPQEKCICGKDVKKGMVCSTKCSEDYIKSPPQQIDVKCWYCGK